MKKLFLIFSVVLLSAFSGKSETFGFHPLKARYHYDGMHIKDVTSDLDAVEGVNFYGRTGWAGSLKGLDVNGMSYNSAGLLSCDGFRGLTNIRYNSNGLPIYFRGNTSNPIHTFEQIYSASGVRLNQYEQKVIRLLNRRTVISDRSFVGPFTFNTDTLERVDFAGGYFDGKGDVHFYHTDWQGNVTMVTDGKGQLEQHNGYYPYGEPWREPKGQHSRLFAGKERFEGLAKGTSDFGPRHHYPALAQWTGIDRLGHRNPRFNTYVFCAANPIKNREVDGNWYIRVSTSEDRGRHPYGTLTLYSQNDEVLYSTVIKAKGAGRIRNMKKHDTPQGYYKIGDWEPRDDKQAYGVNDLLVLYYLPNQEGGSRSAMHLHGGRAEEREESNELWGTHGCIRIHDDDIAEIKQITDYIEAINPKEFGEELLLLDDIYSPVTYQQRDEIKNTFFINLREIIVKPK